MAGLSATDRELLRGHHLRPILFIKSLQLFIDRRVLGFNQFRCFEESLAADGEELCRHFRRIGIEHGFLATIKASPQICEGRVHGLAPALSRHAFMQRWQAIGVAVLHVQLVGKFVNHHIDAVCVFRQFEPGNQYRAAIPGFTHDCVVILMDYSIGVDHVARNHEVARIDHNADPAGIPVEAKVKNRQAGLKGNSQLDAGCQMQPLCTAPLLFGDQLARQLAQMDALVGVKVAKKWQAGFDFIPQRLWNHQTVALPLAPPGGEFVDHLMRRVLSQLPAQNSLASVRSGKGETRRGFFMDGGLCPSVPESVSVSCRKPAVGRWGFRRMG